MGYFQYPAVIANLFKGTATNDSAATGYVGEIVTSNVTTYQNVAASATVFDITSISLTAGDWDVSGNCIYQASGATFTSTDLTIALSTTSGASFGTIDVSNTIELNAVVPTSFNLIYIPSQVVRFSLAATTTVYLKGYVAVFTAGTPRYQGALRARRVR